jgi:type I restriction enzyme, S subunit
MWNTVKLGSIATVIAGQSPKGEHYNKEGKGTPFYQGKKDYGERFLNKPSVWTSVVTKVAEKDDILMSVRAPVGALNIATEQICIGRGLAAIRPTTDVMHDYLFYSLLQIASDLEGSAGAIFNSINKTQIESIDIPLPPLAEQQRIVDKLDAAFTEIDKAVELETNRAVESTTLERAYLEEVFSTPYPVFKLGELGEVKSGGTPNSKEASYWGREIPWYSSGELNNMFACNSEKFITSAGLNNSNAKLFPKGTLLVGMYDTAAMKMSILQQEATFNQAIVGIPPNEFASPEYLFYALKFLKPKILLERRGVRQQNLSLAKIKIIDIPLPKTSVQKEIVEKLNAFHAEQASYQSAITAKRDRFQLLKSAILAQELQPSQSEAA